MKKYRFKLLFLTVISFFLGASTSSAAVDPQLQQAIDLTYNAQYDQAEGILNNYVSSHPDDPLGYMIRGTMMDWKQKILDLKKSLDKRIIADYKTANTKAFYQWEKDEENIDKLINLGNSYLYLSKKWVDLGHQTRAGLILNKCRKHMEEALKKNPQRYDAYLALGVLNFYAANIPPGFSGLAKFLGITGNESLGLSQIEQSAMNSNPLQADALFMLTYAYGNTKKNYAMAQKYLDQLISRYPNNPFYIHLKGEYAYRADMFEPSRNDFNSFFSFCSSNQGAGCAPVFHFLAHYFLSAGYIKENNFSSANSHVESARQINDNRYPDRTANLHLYKGLVLKSEGKNEEAKTEFKEVEKLQGKNKKAWEKAKEAMKGL